MKLHEGRWRFIKQLHPLTHAQFVSLNSAQRLSPKKGPKKGASDKNSHTGSLRNTDASIIRTHSGGPMVSPIEGFHCNICLCTHVQYMSRWVCTSCLTRVYGWCGCCVQSTHTILFLSVALLPIHEYWDIQHSLSVVTVLFWVRTLSGALHTASICQWLGD